MPKFYFTTGRGTEKFAENELKIELNASNVQVHDGHLLCEVPDLKIAAARVGQLRMVERGFVLVSSVATQTINHLVPAVIISVLKQRLLAREWLLEAYSVYRELHQEILQAQTAEEPPSKKQKTEAGQEHQQQQNRVPSFRVSVRCSGRLGKKFNPQMVGGCLGRELAAALQWRVDLRHPDVEVCLHLGDQWFIAGIPLFRHPLSKRSFISDPGLRSTVAAIMSSLARVQPGELVLDPMCGKATVLLEGAMAQPVAVYLGVDKDNSQLATAAANIRHASLPGVMLLQADALNLPLPASSVDKVVCDAPFGQKYLTSLSLEQFYTRFLQEWARVLKPSGLAVLLTSAALKDSIARITSQSQSQAASTSVPQSGRDFNTTSNLSVQPCQDCQCGRTGLQEGTVTPSEGGSGLRCRSERNSDDDCGDEIARASRKGSGSKCLEADSHALQRGEKEGFEVETSECQTNTGVSRVGSGCDSRVSSQEDSAMVWDLGEPITDSTEETNSSSASLGRLQNTRVAVLPSCDDTDAADSMLCQEYREGREHSPHPCTSKQGSHSGHQEPQAGSGGRTWEGACQAKEETRNGSNSSGLAFEKSLCITEQHYVKLGETHAYIIVMKCYKK